MEFKPYDPHKERDLKFERYKKRAARIKFLERQCKEKYPELMELIDLWKIEKQQNRLK